MSSSEAAPSASAGPSNVASGAAGAARAQAPEPKQLVTRLLDDKLGECHSWVWRRLPACLFAVRPGRADLSASDLRAKLVVAGEIKDMSEAYQGQDLAAFINVFVPVALAVLGKMPCSLHTEAPEQVRVFASASRRLAHLALCSGYATAC